MYSIVLTDGKIVNIIADDVRWDEKEKMARFQKKWKAGCKNKHG